MFYIELIKKDKLSDKNEFKKIEKIKRIIKGIDIEYIGDENTYYGTNVDKIAFKVKINMYKINLKTIKKLDKIISIILEKNAYLSSNFYENKNERDYIILEKYLDSKGVNIVNKKNLKNNNKFLKILLLDMLEKISSDINVLKMELRIGVSVNEINQDIIFILEDIAIKYKEVVVITKNEVGLKCLKNKLYENYGIIININNMSLFLKSDIVINFENINNDRDMKKKLILSRCICINVFGKENNSNLKVLEGININGLELDFNMVKVKKEYKVYFDKLNGFRDVDIYESLNLKNTSIQNMINKIRSDNVLIRGCIGERGRINQREFIKFGKSFNLSKNFSKYRKKCN